MNGTVFHQTEMEQNVPNTFSAHTSRDFFTRNETDT
jgi:hypothetical protein